MSEFFRSPQILKAGLVLLDSVLFTVRWIVSLHRVRLYRAYVGRHRS
jgi:hypothetical protein